MTAENEKPGWLESFPSSYRKFFHPDGDGDATTAYILDFGCRIAINLPMSAATN